MRFIFELKIFLTKIKKLDFVFKSLRLYFYVLFLIANRNICAKVISVASTRVSTSRKLKNINAIIAFINAINSLYIDRSSSSSRTKFLYLLKFQIDFTN